MDIDPTDLKRLQKQASDLMDKFKAGELTDCPSCQSPITATHDMRGWSVECKCGWSMSASGYNNLAPGAKPN